MSLEENPNICNVCFDPFGSTKIPRLLPCAHSFCFTCLTKILDYKTQETVHCPECRKTIPYFFAEEVPINFGLRDSIEYFLSKKDVTLEMKQKETLDMIMEIEKKHLSRLDDLKREKIRNKKIVNNLKQHERAIKKAKSEKDLKKANELFKQFMSECKIVPPQSVKNKSMTTPGASTAGASLHPAAIPQNLYPSLLIHEEIQKLQLQNFQFLHGKTVLLDLLDFFEKKNINLRFPTLKGSSVKYGKLTIGQDNRIRIQFLDIKEEKTPLKLENLLDSLNVPVLPKEAYFKVRRKFSLLGEFIVKVDNLSPRGLNFILLASGILNQSYRGTSFKCTTEDVAGGFDLNEKKHFSALVDGIRDGGIYSSKGRRGIVGGTYAGAVNVMSFFRIQKNDFEGELNCKFGEVTKGIEIIDNISSATDYIEECGLIV